MRLSCHCYLLIHCIAFPPSGNFLFIETSYPRRRGEKAWLYSPYLSQSPKGKCLNFWYHMYGTHIGALNIYLDRATGTPIWNRTGDQGNMWRHGRVNLQSYTRFRVCFDTNFLLLTWIPTWEGFRCEGRTFIYICILCACSSCDPRPSTLDPRPSTLDRLYLSRLGRTLAVNFPSCKPLGYGLVVILYEVLWVYGLVCESFSIVTRTDGKWWIGW